MIKKGSIILITFFSLLILFSACEKKSPETIDFAYDYYDLTPGRYIIYSVIDIEHDVNLVIQHDTNYYQLKTVVGDTFIDNSGRIAREFLRFKRDSAQGVWQLKDVWTTIIDNQKAELVEENQRIVKMVFKPTLEKVWNINMFNVSPKINARFTSIDAPFTSGNNYFEKTIKVDIQNLFSLVDDRVKYEVYAKGIGLIYNYFKDNTIVNFDKKDIKKGNELFYTYIESGIE